MKRIPYMLVLALVITGCDKSQYTADTVFYRSAVGSYYTTDTIYVETDVPNGRFYLRIKPTEKIMKGYRYTQLCIKHADTSFNYQGFYYWDNIYRGSSVARDFADIDLVSDADYDERHPAGASLADIVEFRTMTPKPFIDSDYRYEYPNEQVEGDYLPHKVMYKWFWPVCRLMADLTPGDMTMMGVTDRIRYADMAAFRFVVAPEATGKYDMTLTMTTDKAEVFKARFEAVFE